VRTCAICFAVSDETVAPTCPRCGEASWLSGIAPAAPVPVEAREEKPEASDASAEPEAVLPMALTNTGATSPRRNRR